MSSSDQAGPGAPTGAVTIAQARRGLLVLCATVTISYGALFYAFPVLSTAIAADTGWSITVITAFFSGSQVVAGLAGIAVGRRLQRHGPRPVMTMAALLAPPALVAIAAAPGPAVFGAAWLVAGFAMAGLFYPPAFAALTSWYGAGRVRALTVLTLVAALASTVFAPLTASLEVMFGWRGAYLVLAAVMTVTVVPLHTFALPRPWRTASESEHAASDEVVAQVVRSRAFWSLTASLGLGTLTVQAVVVNLVALLQSHGLTATTAAWALGLGGVGQVLGRLVYGPLERRSRHVERSVAVLGACALTTLLLALVPGPSALVLLLALLAGTARGVLTLLKATAVSDRWGTTNYAALNGVMQTPIMLSAALAPWAGAALAVPLGGYPAAFAVLAALAGFAALIATAGGSTPRSSPDARSTTRRRSASPLPDTRRENP
ncbi:MFS transporter [Nocardiopsis sp. NPDC049922]|uniref:MFS transporter n=1 Tax=Nocardiopsis sp. NPDC049922 TaxID=3155157 RepID=UPI00340AAA87